MGEQGTFSLQSVDYQKILRRFKERRNESVELFKIFDKLVVDETFLTKATICLSIGPAAGQNDLDFLQKCLPNLKKYIAVDKKASSLERLKENFQKIYGDSVEYESHVIDVATLELSDEKVDIVWMSHMLYCIPKVDRLIIFDNLLKKIIKPETGRIIFVNNTEENIFQKLHKKIGIRPLLTSAEIKKDFEEVGGTVTWSRVYSCDFDAMEYDEDLMYYFMEFSDRILTPEEIMGAVKALAPSGRSDYQCEISIVKNT